MKRSGWQLVYVFVVIAIYSSIITLSCTKRPGQIKKEDSESRIEVIERRLVGSQVLRILRDKETGSEFLLTDAGGIVKIK